MDEDLYWHCRTCDVYDIVEQPGDGSTYHVGDKEKCIDCGEDFAEVVTAEQWFNSWDSISPLQR